MAAPDAPDFLVLAEVDNAAAMAGPLFERKFGHPMPDWPNDVIAFVRRGDGSLYPMSYAKFFPLGSVMLVGGCCTDGRAFDGLDAGQRALLQGDRTTSTVLDDTRSHGRSQPTPCTACGLSPKLSRSR